MNIQRTHNSPRPANLTVKKQSTEDCGCSQPKESFQASQSSDSNGAEWKKALAVVGASVGEGVLQGAGYAFLNHLAYAAGGPVVGGVAKLALTVAGGFEGAHKYGDAFAQRTGSKALGKMIGATMGAGKVTMYTMGVPGDYTSGIVTGMSNGALFGLLEAPTRARG